MQKTTVVIIGGGATGAGILRDLSMRGVKAILLERYDLACGTSSRFHGLLHSGGRYAVTDEVSARECIEENKILRKVAGHCIEDIEGYFVRLPDDDEKFEKQWVKACEKIGIPAVNVSSRELLRLETNLTPRIVSAYRVPDSAVDGFRLVWHNIMSARRYGGLVRTYSEVTEIKHVNNQVVGVEVRNIQTGETYTIACDYIINATGSWVGETANLAGIEVNMKPDRGVLIVFNSRFTSRIINRLHIPGDGDIFVPHGSVVVYGTTSSEVASPDDCLPITEEVLKLLAIGKRIFENLSDYRILRAFAGTRPLYSPDQGTTGRSVSRNFTILDHTRDGLKGFASITGGKLTIYRLMAEEITEIVCNHLGINRDCRTALEPLIEVPPAQVMEKGRKYFPAFAAGYAVSRLGPGFTDVIKRIQDHPDKKQLVCECELVTLAEVEEVAADNTTYCVSDIRRRTRIGMGTCQGTFCGFRGVGTLVTNDLAMGKDGAFLLKDFLQGRWIGIRPVLWGEQVREVELMRSIYDATLNINGANEYDET